MTVNVAVIGAGQWGKNHLRVLNELHQANLVCVVEKDLNKAKYYSSLYHIGFETSFTEAVKRSDIDAFIIATPNCTHHELASEAIKNGKHIMVEKPMCLSSKDAMELIDLAETHSVTLMAGHVFSFNPAVLKLKEIIDEGDLGNLHFILCSRLGLYPPRPDSGVIIDLALHDFDIISLLLNRRRPRSVMAAGKSYLRQLFEEIAFITLEYGDNVIAHTSASWLTPAKIRTCWVAGTDRTAFLDLLPQTIEIFEQRIEKVVNDNKDELYDLVTKQGLSYKPHINVKESLKEEDSHFIECVEKRKRPKIDGRVALETILIAEAAVESLEMKKYIEFEKFNPDAQSYLEILL